MAALLKVLLPKLYPYSDDVAITYVTHEGKKDLKKSVRVKIKGWREPNVHFVVILDQDKEDCFQLKSDIEKICKDAGRSDTLIRIVCRELEAWYFGELNALEQAYLGSNIVRKIKGKRQYRFPDQIVGPAKKIGELIPEFRKVDAARRMGQLLSRDNTSPSFRVFLNGIDKLYQSIRTTA